MLILKPDRIIFMLLIIIIDDYIRYFKPKPIVFIDEAQRVKNIGLILKIIIDP